MKTLFRYLTTAVSLILALWLLGACGGLFGPSGTIRIVSSFPLTGGDSVAGKSLALATQQAIQDHGLRSGNYTLEYLSLDDASVERNSWDAAYEIANANRAISDEQVLAYMGAYNSSATKLSIPILNVSGPMVIVSPSSTYPGLTKSVPGVTQVDEPDKYYPTGERNFARAVPADEIQGAVNAQWAKELGVTSVYILDDQQSYGKGVANVFENTARELGIEVLGHQSINTQAPNFTAQAAAIAQAKPDLFYFGGVTSSRPGDIWKALRAAGYNGKYMGPDGLLTDGFLQDAGDAAEGTYITFAGLPVAQLIEVSPEGKKWYEEYKQRFGSEPDVYASYAYEATLMVLKAIDACVAKNDVSRRCVRDQVFTTRNFKGILGREWSLDANGDTTLTTMTKNIVENGKFKYIGLAQLP